VVKTLLPPEVLKERHWEVRGSFVEAEDPEGRKVRIPGPVPKMSESPPRVRRIRPGLGQDAEEINRKYGLTS
jgi:formyl-CoA transferase